VKDFRASWGPGWLLRSHPVAGAAVYAATGALSTFLTGAYGVRLQEELGFGKIALGLAVGAFFVTGAVTGLTMGRIVDRIGASTALRIGTGAACAGALILAGARGWWTVAVAMIVIGFAGAITNVASNRILVVRARIGGQATGFGVKQAAIPVASLLAGLSVSTLGTHMSWREAYLVAAAIAGLMALSVPRVRQRPTPPLEQAPNTARTMLLVAFAGIGALAGAAGNALSLLLVDSFHTVGLSEASGGALLGIGSVAAILSRLGSGALIDRRGWDGRAMLIALLSVGAVGFAGLAVAGGDSMLVVPAVVLAFAGGWGWPGVLYFAATREEAPPGYATGLVLSGVMIGSIVGPPGTAVIAEHVGYGPAWAASAGLLAGGAMLAGVVWSRQGIIRSP